MANKGKSNGEITCTDGEAEIIYILNKIYKRAGWILFWIVLILIGIGGSNY